MRKRNGFFGLLIIVLSAVTVLFTAGTVQGQENPRHKARERWYRERESALLADTRDYLDRAGFCHSGVTLNRTVEAGGDRSYTFTIHHSGIDGMSDAQKKALERELAGLTEGFEAAGEARCSFSYRFLT